MNKIIEFWDTVIYKPCSGMKLGEQPRYTLTPCGMLLSGLCIGVSFCWAFAGSEESEKKNASTQTDAPVSTQSTDTRKAIDEIFTPQKKQQRRNELLAQYKLVTCTKKNDVLSSQETKQQLLTYLGKYLK